MIPGGTKGDSVLLIAHGTVDWLEALPAFPITSSEGA
jgi:hypothetical protein